MTALKGSLTGTSAAGRRWTVRDGLVIGQMAVTTLLLVMAGLLVRSLMASQHASVGFDTHGLAMVSTDTDMLRYSSARSHQFYDEAMRRVRALPGVESVAVASRLPFSINYNSSNIAIPGHQKSADEMGPAIDSSQVSPDYFRTIGVSLLQGRNFTEQDQPETPRVVVINETMARKYWPNGDAIGQQLFRRTLSSGQPLQVVGIVADHKLSTVGETARPAIYFSMAQESPSYQVVVARTRGDEQQLLAEMRRTMFELEPGVLLVEQHTMQYQLGATLFPIRVAATLVSVFGGLGLLLAAVGLYGVIAFSVARRAREIGIRMAIGARPGMVLTMVMRQGLVLAVAGLVVGFALAAAATKIVAGALYQVSAADPVSWTLAAIVVIGVAALANYIPAQRAMRLEPSRVLRSE